LFYDASGNVFKLCRASSAIALSGAIVTIDASANIALAAAASAHGPVGILVPAGCAASDAVFVQVYGTFVGAQGSSDISTSHLNQPQLVLSTDGYVGAVTTSSGGIRIHGLWARAVNTTSESGTTTLGGITFTAQLNFPFAAGDPALATSL
jgi:hypothetical protein